MREKLDDLRTTDRARKQAEVKVPPGHARYRRQALPVEAVLQYGRLSAWCPGTAAVGTLTQSALVDEDDGAAFVFGLFFYPRPALLLPPSDLVFVALQGAARGTLTTPAQPPQDAPSLGRMVGNPTFLLDQMGDTAGGPQTGLVAQSFRTAFESLLDLAQILRAQAWLAARTARLLQSSATFLA